MPGLHKGVSTQCTNQQALAKPRHQPLERDQQARDRLRHNVRSNLTIHHSDTPFVIWQPIRRPRLLDRVYKPIRTWHWCGDLRSLL